MKTNRIARLVVAASLTVMNGYAQTAAEQMQKGIYTQETAGDLDGAIAIYRQIVNSGNSPRDIAAQAQYRLAQSLLQKGDLSNAAQEFEKLARSYADFGNLVSSLAATARVYATPNSIVIPYGRGGRGGAPIADANLTPEQRADQLKALEANIRALRAVQEAKAAAAADASLTPEQRQAADEAKFAIALARLAELQKAGALPGGGGGRGTGGGQLNSMSFDPSSTVTVKGSAFRIDLVFPSGSISVDPNDGTGKRYTFATAAPAELIRQGWTKDNIRVGDEVTITGLLATGGQTLPNGTIAASATTITAADGRKLFDRAAIQK